MSRQHAWRAEHPTAVIVDRTTAWGNPIRIQAGTFVRAPSQAAWGVRQVDTAVEAVELFRQWMTGEIEVSGATRPNLGYLRGQDLACWCAPDAACHADVLIELANA